MPFASKARAHVERRVGRRDARLRPRLPHRDPDGRGRRCWPACASSCAARVKFIFQPAEEMPPEGEDGGAKMMIAGRRAARSRAAGDLRPARHVAPAVGVHRLSARARRWPAPTRFSITVHGRQTHGAMPWLGVDPIVTAAQVVLGPADHRQPRRRHHARAGGRDHRHDQGRRAREHHPRHRSRCAARSAPSTKAMRDDIHERVTHAGRGGVARLARRLHGVHQQELPGHRQRPGAHRGDAAHAAARRRRRQGAAGRQGHRLGGFLVLPAASCPGCSSSSASRRPSVDPAKAPPNHSPRFYVDERALLLGVRSLAHLACDFLEARA